MGCFFVLLFFSGLGMCFGGDYFIGLILMGCAGFGAMAYLNMGSNE